MLIEIFEVRESSHPAACLWIVSVTDIPRGAIDDHSAFHGTDPMGELMTSRNWAESIHGRGVLLSLSASTSERRTSGTSCRNAGQGYVVKIVSTHLFCGFTEIGAPVFSRAVVAI